MTKSLESQRAEFEKAIALRGALNSQIKAEREVAREEERNKLQQELKAMVELTKENQAMKVVG